jgi:gluconolactonase
MRRFVDTAGRRLRRLLCVGLALVLSGVLAASAGLGGPAQAQTPTPVPAAPPVQPWGLPPLPPGVGPVEKFADVSGTPQGQFLEGGAFDSQGNLWFVAIGSGWGASCRSIRAASFSGSCQSLTAIC